MGFLSFKRIASLLFLFVELTMLICWSQTSALTSNQSRGGEPTAWAKASQGESLLRGFDLSSLDRNCQPCQDFYRFANGGWMEKNPIPAAYSRWGRFEQLNEQNQNILHQLLEQLLSDSNHHNGRNEQKVADFYTTCMNEQKIESAGINPLNTEIKRINEIHDTSSLVAEVANLHAQRIPAIFGFGAVQDFKNSSSMIVQIVQGGLGLPDRDYYTKDDARSKQTREEYVRHMARMFELMGDGPMPAADEAKTVLSIETKLALGSLTREQRRNPEANYHKMNPAQLSELAQHYDWSLYFRNLGLGSVEAVNVGQPEFFKVVDSSITAIPIDDWKIYLRWHLINAAAAMLSSKFVEEDFNFNGKYLTGTQEILPRWKRCVASTDRALGEALGELYIKKTFTPQAQARAREMVRNLVAALRDDLSTLDWMSEPTRLRAIAKLEAFVRKIGYPEKWRNYEALQISRGAYYNNSVNAGAFEFKRNLAKLGKPVDRTEWGMTPPTVNAYYNPSMNEIVFPAGILQAPFYDPEADEAFNYGGIGAVIGHEMTHGFDDQGAKFDAEGNLLNWWTPTDYEQFKARTDCVVKQFDAYEVEPGLHQIGARVVGESVADLGGLTIAFAAYQKSLQGKPRPRVIAGFTPEQRFFLGYAQVWAQNIRPEAARLRVATDPHPLGRFRVNGPVSNIPAFAQAFGCKLGDAMVRPANKRCQIW